jgi:pimeloyl-ACP methyl ester carboxylesterase
MTTTTRHMVATNGIRLAVTEEGQGPPVLLCHGFPETAHSWRHQIGALAAAGYRVLAPDLRGYGSSDCPDGVGQYTILHLVGDLVGLLDALDEPAAAIVGHDWGATLAWHAALLRPDRFTAVAGLSVPFRQRAAARPTSVMPRTAAAEFYQLYFQRPGVAEAELDPDPRRSLRTMYAGAAGEPAAVDIGMVQHGSGFLRGGWPGALPPWLTEQDLDAYTADFARTGFRPALSWYRNVDRNWELLAPFAGRVVTVPALYLAGANDFVLGMPGVDRVLRDLDRVVPDLRGVRILPGCGHWTQQERPAEVNAALLGFLRG